MFSKPLTERLRPSLSGPLSGLSTGPQIDFSQVAAINARDIFREPVTAPAVALRGYVKPLSELPASTERNQLLYEYLSLCERLDDFLGRTTAERVQELELQCADLWAKCRSKEDEVKALSAEAARYDQQSNQAGFLLGEARAKVMEAIADRHHDTRFPTVKETTAYQDRCQQAADVRYQREQDLANINRYLVSAREKAQAAKSELRDLMEQVCLLDGKLTRLRQP
jgi:hypothetical protein